MPKPQPHPEPDRTQHRARLQHLRANRTDLTQPLRILHILRFNSLTAATHAATELKTHGFTNVRALPADGASFFQRLLDRRLCTCLAETHFVPTEATLFAAIDQLSAIARKHAGQYADWKPSED